MNLAALFGDDEHTASEDSYTRAMKSRKWLVVAAAFFFVTHEGLFAPAPFSVLIGKVTMALDLWKGLTAAGLAYAAAQYFLVIVQLALRYPATLEQRFGLRQAQKAKAAEQELFSVMREIEGLDGTRPMSATAAAALTSPAANATRLRALNQRAEALTKVIEDAPAVEQPSTIYAFAEVLIDILRLGAPWAAFALAVFSR